MNTTLGEERRTSVVYARATAVRPFSFALLEGYTRARVLTYSASVPTILRFLERFEDFECVFGYEQVAARAEQVWAYQQVVHEGLLKEALALDDGLKNELFRRIREHTARFHVLKTALSHAKLYLLDGPNGHLVLMGSANVSERALFDPALTTGPAQLEVLAAFEDDLAWAHYAGLYEAVREHSSNRLTLPGEPPNTAEVLFERLPVNAEAESSGSAVLPANVVAPPPVLTARAERLTKSYRPVAEQLDKVRGQPLVKLPPSVLGKLARLVRQARATDAQQVTHLALHGARDALVLNGDPLPLDAPEEEVRRDAELLARFFESYRAGFVGPVARQQQLYFALLAWLYASPLMVDFLNAARLQNLPPYAYPLFAVLHGKANCGKTQLLKVLMKSMFGAYVFRESADLTATHLRGLQAESGRFPVVFEDVERTRFQQHAPALIKATTDHGYLEEDLAPMVFSMNADENSSFPEEIRKRCLMIYTPAQFPADTSSEAFRANYKLVTDILHGVGTGFYRTYLRRLLAAVRPGEAPGDVLALSSRVVAGLLEEATGRSYPWCAEVSLAAVQALQKDRVREVLLDLWRTNARAWQIGGDRVTLRLGTYEVPGLKRDLPGYLVNDGASKGGNLVLHRKELEAFLGRRLQRGWWNRFGR